MILDPTATLRSRPAKAGRPTLDDLFRRAMERHGDATALVDPPNRASFTDGAPRRLTWAQADRAVSAIAARLTGLGLPTDAIVALQLPNIVESVLALLGVLRAGMIAAPLPLLWRQVEATEALGRIGARAIVTCRRVGPIDHGEIAMHVAAETFSIRFVCAFGDGALDGVVALDDVFDGASDAPLAVTRAGDPAAHVAVVTFDVAGDGLVPVARNHDELIAGGIAVALEGPRRARCGDPGRAHHLVVRRPRHHDRAVAHERRHADAAPAVRSGGVCGPVRRRRHDRRCCPARWSRGLRRQA